MARDPENNLHVTGNSIRLGRLLGVELRLDYSWFIIFGLIAWMLAGHHFPMMSPGWTPVTYWTVGIVASLLFFASVVAHELAHSTVSGVLGLPVRDITLFIFGGAARLTREPQRPRDEFLIAAVGPAASLVIAAAFWGLSRLGAAPNSPVFAAASWLASINVVLAVFNLIPGFPLDGGRVLRAIIWGATGSFQRATQVAVFAGRAVAFIMMFWGVWQIFAGNLVGGLWIAFIGWFLDNAAARTLAGVALKDVLAGYTVRDAIMTDCPQIQPDMTLDEVVHKKVLPSGRRCFPVVADGALRGLLTLHRIKEVPKERWPVTRTEDVMIVRDELKTVRPTDPLSTVFERMANEDVNQFPVMDDGRLVGMIARDALLKFVALRSELQAWRAKAVDGEPVDEAGARAGRER